MHTEDLAGASSSDLLDAFVASRALVARESARQARLLVALQTRAVGLAAREERSRVGADGVRAGNPLGDASRREELVRRSLVAELAVAARESEALIAREIDEAERLVLLLPRTHAALADGRIGMRHARAVVEQSIGIDSRPADGSDADGRDAARRLALFDAEAMPIAESQTPPITRRRMRRVRERLLPQSIEIRAERAVAERRLVLEDVDDGMAWLHHYLPAVEAHAAYDRLSRLARPVARRGVRTLAQARSDVARDLLLGGVRTGSGGPDSSGPNSGAPVSGSPVSGSPVSGGPGSGSPVPGSPVPGSPVSSAPFSGDALVRATVHVTVPVLTLLGHSNEPAELDGYGPIDAVTARRLAAHAPSFTRILTHPETGVVLSIGRSSYAVPADLKRFVTLRDGTCRFPGCARRARSCELDHTTAWVDGGATAHDNLASLCASHHHLKHESGWRVRAAGGARLEWRSPLGRSYETAPAPP